MDVLLTFDVEVWCNGWDSLDESFPGAFRRYVYGTSNKGQFALPWILDTLAKRALKAAFFVEPMFAGRFGLEYLARIVEMIKAADQEVQLHLHPEWTDEIHPCPLERMNGKRQHLQHYSVDEQSSLVAYGLRALKTVGVESVTAFRAGSFAANEDTFNALAANGVRQDSSVNATFNISVPDLRRRIGMHQASKFKGIEEYPLSVFVDGLGRQRHAQIGACSTSEITAAIESAEMNGWRHFVLLAHNFELLRPGSAEPDRFVVERFERLCRYLGRRKNDLPTRGFSELSILAPARKQDVNLPHVPVTATLLRHSEQLLRRLYPKA